MIFICGTKASNSGLRIDDIRVIMDKEIFIEELLDNSCFKRFFYVPYGYGTSNAKPIKSMSAKEFNIIFNEEHKAALQPALKLFRKEVQNKYGTS